MWGPKKFLTPFWPVFKAFFGISPEIFAIVQKAPILHFFFFALTDPSGGVWSVYKGVLNFNKVFYLLLKLVNCSLLSPCYVIIDNLDSLDNFLYHSKNNVKNCKESDKLHSLCSKMTQYNPELGSVPSQHLRQSFL